MCQWFQLCTRRKRTRKSSLPSPGLSSTHKRPIKIKLEKVSRKNAPEYFKSLSCDGGATRVAWIKDARHLSTVHVFFYLSVSLVMPWHDNLQQFMRFVTSGRARPKKELLAYLKFFTSADSDRTRTGLNSCKFRRLRRLTLNLQLTTFNSAVNLYIFFFFVIWTCKST